MKSELRLIETLDGICDRILQYNIHKVPQKNLLSIKILPVQIQCQFSFIIPIPKKIRRGKIRQDLQKVKVKHSALWRVWWPKVWRWVQITWKPSWLFKMQRKSCKISTPAHPAYVRSWMQQLQHSHSLFKLSLNANFLQVDIGIPHELWDKPSAEVKC